MGASTSVAATLGYFRRGPLDTPLLLSNLEDLEREFGGLHPDDEAGYAIRQFFLNGGSNAWVVRVASGTPRAASVDLGVNGTADVLTATAGRRVGGRSVEDPGVWGDNVRLVVDYDTRDRADTTLFNLTVFEVERRDGRRNMVRSERYTNISTVPGTLGAAVDLVNETSKLVQLTAFGGLPARPVQSGTTGGPVDPAAVFAPTSTLNVHIDGGSAQVATLDTIPAGTTFTEGAVALGQALERAINLTGELAGEPALAGASVTIQGDRFRVLAGGGDKADFDPSITITFTENGVTTAADLGLLAAEANVQEYSLGGAGGFQTNGVTGNDGTAPDRAALLGDFDDRLGLYALHEVGEFNILLIPGAVAQHMTNDDAASVYTAAESFCESQRAFLIVDVPAGIDEVQALQDWIDDRNIRHPNAAVYFPRIHASDPLADGGVVSFGASGTMAGVYARTDRERGVWKAPAGPNAVLRNVQGFDALLTEPENAQLNQVAINALRQFPMGEPVAWGARTLNGADVSASEWRYVAVRRLALFVEESLRRGLRLVVFEPNGEPLWSHIRHKVGAFMEDLFRKGAFQGSSPRDAYFVKCDNDTTTQNDVNLGVVNTLVGFAPLRPAEFVTVTIQQKVDPAWS